MPQIPEKIHELTVGQLAARSGAAVSALHFYEAKGLIGSRRTPGNQRRYGRDALRRRWRYHSRIEFDLWLDRNKDGRALHRKRGSRSARATGNEQARKELRVSFYFATLNFGFAAFFKINNL